MRSLELHADYDRKGIHDIFDPDIGERHGRDRPRGGCCASADLAPATWARKIIAIDVF